VVGEEVEEGDEEVEEGDEVIDQVN